MHIYNQMVYRSVPPKVLILLVKRLDVLPGVDGEVFLFGIVVEALNNPVPPPALV